MSSLHRLQSRFVADLLAPDGRSSEAPDSYVRGDGLDPAERVAIYRNNIFSNYRAALRAVYPVVEKLVGERFFSRMADEFIRQCPSATGDLDDYGAGLAEFLAAFLPAQGLPYLADVARLEWFIDEAFHAADHPPLAMHHLAAVARERYGELRFRFHPACRLIESRYPVARIWQVNQPQWTGDGAVDLDQGGARLLVHRDGFEVAMRYLNAGTFAMLTEIAAGGAFAGAYTRASGVDAAFDVSGFLREYIGAGILVDFELAGRQQTAQTALQKL